MAPSITRAEVRAIWQSVKPAAVRKGSRVGIFAPASPAEETRVQRGLEEIRNLGFDQQDGFSRQSQAYFSASTASRLKDFRTLLHDPEISALIALRGGYGSNYMLDELCAEHSLPPKCIVGYSDVTSLQILLWQKFHWTSLYGPMVAAGLDAGADAPRGYDRPSFESAISGSSPAWKLNLQGESILGGFAEGIVLGGCMNLIETSLGAPWALDTTGGILLLEDRGMKPWQIDRTPMHLMQAGENSGVVGVVFGGFSDCGPPLRGSPRAQKVCERILKPLAIPIVYGAAVGPTPRPPLTVPLGIPPPPSAPGSGTLEFLETPVSP